MQLRPASKRTLLIRRTLIVGVAALLTACSGGIDDTLEQTIEQKFDLALTGSLSVRNEDGSIHLYCSDRPGVKLQAVKRGYSAERMAKIRLDVSVSNDVMSIATIFPPKNKWSWTDRSGTVDYTLIVPQQLGRTNLELVDGVVSIEGLRGGSAKVSLRNGRISARNCFADLDFQSAGGTISFSYDWWEKKSYSVKATIGNG